METLSEILEAEVDQGDWSINMRIPNHPLAVSARVSQGLLSDPGLPGMLYKGPCLR